MYVNHIYYSEIENGCRHVIGVNRRKHVRFYGAVAMAAEGVKVTRQNCGGSIS